MRPTALICCLAIANAANVEPTWAQSLAPGESITVDSSTGNYLVTFVGAGGQSMSAAYEPASKLSPVVDSAFSGTTGVVSYRYSIQNPSTSLQSLRRMQFVASSIAARRDLAATANDAALSDSDLSDRASACREAVLTPTHWRNICVDAGQNPPQGLLQGILIGWSYVSSGSTKKGVAPGSGLPGFGFDSNDLPGVALAQIKGGSKRWLTKQPYPGDSDTYSLSDALSQQLLQIEQNDNVPRYVAAPLFAVPSQFSVASCGDLMNRLYIHVAEWGPELLATDLQTQIRGWLGEAASGCGTLPAVTYVAVPLNKIRTEFRKRYPALFVTGLGAATPVMLSHDQKLAIQVVDFDLSYVLNRICTEIGVPSGVCNPG